MVQSLQFLHHGGWTRGLDNYRLAVALTSRHSRRLVRADALHLAPSGHLHL